MAAARVAVIMAAHNRRDTTLSCLRAIDEQRSPDTEILVVLVDDGSTDGTSAAVNEAFPEVRVVHEDGTLYWAAAMALAEREALGLRPDYVLWLNDDVVVQPGAVAMLLETAAATRDRAIVCGAAVDPATGALTYSGVNRVDRHPMRFELVRPGSAPVPAHTFNGNVVLVPVGVADAVAGIDGGFAHAMADFDYGLRARRLGYDVVVAPGSIATCTRGMRRGARFDPDAATLAQWRALLAPRGLPPRSLARYLRRHGGKWWPLFVVSPYAKFWAAASLAMLRGRRTHATTARNEGRS